MAFIPTSLILLTIPLRLVTIPHLFEKISDDSFPTALRSETGILIVQSITSPVDVTASNVFIVFYYRFCWSTRLRSTKIVRVSESSTESYDGALPFDCVVEHPVLFSSTDNIAPESLTGAPHLAERTLHSLHRDPIRPVRDYKPLAPLPASDRSHTTRDYSPAKRPAFYRSITVPSTQYPSLMSILWR